MKVIVTGGTGRAGRAIVRDLLDHGYEVGQSDIVRPQGWGGEFRLADLTDYGQTLAALHGFDVVIHMAANPEPDRDHFTGAQRFHNNTMSTYNVFNAAVALKLQRVIWASSETIYGLPLEVNRPKFVPVTEEHPYAPMSSYAISKVISEQMAREFNRLSGIPFIGLQFSNIIGPDVYKNCPTFWADPTTRIWNLWSYIDENDAAQSARLSITADIQGAEVFMIAAADSIMNTPNHDLLARYFPELPIPDGLQPYESLLSSAKAQRMLGFKPEYSWRKYVPDGSV